MPYAVHCTYPSSASRGKRWWKQEEGEMGGRIKRGTWDVVVQLWGGRAAGCLEDQTACMKGDGETVVSKKPGLCCKPARLWVKNM